MSLETDAGMFWQSDVAVGDDLTIREPSEWRKRQRVYFGAPQSERGDDVLAEERAAVRPECATRPATSEQIVKDLQIAGQAVAMHGVEYENIGLAIQPPYLSSSFASARENRASPAARGQRQASAICVCASKSNGSHGSSNHHRSCAASALAAAMPALTE
jgi:hypothetical protein